MGNRRFLPKLRLLFSALSNEDGSREAWENFMKAFVCMKPRIRKDTGKDRASKALFIAAFSTG